MNHVEDSIVLAHIHQFNDSQWQPHLLEDHLRSVAKLSEAFANIYGHGDWAYMAGLWHDLGKYQKNFQQYIRGASGYQAHIESLERVDHSTAGAIYAQTQVGDIKGRILAYIIAGHHAGLADWEGDETAGTLSPRLKQHHLLEQTLTQPIPNDILTPRLPTSRPQKGVDPALWIRMLFSCLVDADFLDTEAFMDEQRSFNRGPYESLIELAARFDTHMDGLANKVSPSAVNQIRAEILQRCQEQAVQPPGLFSLTVPTGGGKTLSSMAFALRHALQHGKQRIIYVIPYTSIIEQTADVFRSIFDEAVVEHHSHLDAEQETPKSRLACENWDAPIIVTTAVQFFESLFASRTSRVRKLHNIINSVVILDEAQLLPTDFLTPILYAIDQLQQHYKVSFVFSTATQPALHPQDFGWPFTGLANIRELMKNPQQLHQALRRVQVNLPSNLHTGQPWDTLAEALKQHESVLCIVDRRDDCRRLHAFMPSGTIHLSGLMCGQHRSDVIANIKSRLRQGESLRVISTQLIEAGVDVDFPVVYRALAGLDSIAQAAGRCNREGKLPGMGDVFIFTPPQPAPPGHLRHAQDCGRQLLAQQLEDILSIENFTAYFSQLYSAKGPEGLDRHGIQSYLKPNPEMKFAFRGAARHFRIIDESQHAPVIVRYQHSPDLIEQLRHQGPHRELLRKLQRFVVNLPRQPHQALLSQGDIQELHPGIFIQVFDHLYHPELGLPANAPAYHEPDTLII